jgi:photosystem II stability/assembly factor-like uncharacterized protein
MKRILPFIVLLLCTGSSFAQLNVWRWQNPVPVGGYLRAVQMISLNTIYICGDVGNFMRSSDGGQSWDIQNSVLKLNANLNALSFLDQNNGMCAGDSGVIIKTTDGGTSWVKLKSTITSKINGILVVDINIAVAVCNTGAILRTTDGGSTWNPVPLEGTGQLFSVRMLRPDFITITGFGGVLLISTDKGMSWPQVPLREYGNSFYSADFTDNNNGTLIGEYGLILHTTDGGTTWVKQFLVDSAIISSTLNVVDGKDPNVQAIVGDYGTLLYTSNAGATWRQFYIGTTDPIKGLSFFDNMTAIAVGRNGTVLQTTDGGASWVYLPHKAFTNSLHAVGFPKGDTSLGIAVGELGTILRTTNGGKSWALVDSGFSTTMRGVCFIDSMNVIAVGDNGSILKSIDAGVTWNLKDSVTTANLYSVSFSTPKDGLAVGDRNTILRTYSAGNQWTREFVPVGDTDFFNSVSYPDVNHAFATGFHGYYASTNGGVDWKYFTPDASLFTSFVFHGISFADSLHGGIIYSNGPDGSPIVFWYAKFTSNGGASWDSVSTANGVPLNNIQCVDRQHATIVGNGGYIYHTTDGGNTLNLQASNTLNNLYGVGFGTIKAGTAVGNRGNIIRILSDDKLAVGQISASGSPKPILDPCYPNPAATSATISYYLPSGGFASLKIYSADGKEMAAMVNGYTQIGEQKTQCDVSRFPSGSYLIRLDFGGVSVSQKLTVMR